MVARVNSMIKLNRLKQIKQSPLSLARKAFCCKNRQLQGVNMLISETNKPISDEANEISIKNQGAAKQPAFFNSIEIKHLENTTTSTSPAPAA